MKLIAVIAVGTLLVACGKGGGSVPTSVTVSYADARAIGDALTSAGLGCADYEARETSSAEDDAGRCTIDGESVRIIRFANTNAQQSWVTDAQTLGCQVSSESRAVVQGDRWLIEPSTEAEAKSIAERFGGSSKAWQCS